MDQDDSIKYQLTIAIIPYDEQTINYSSFEKELQGYIVSDFKLFFLGNIFVVRNTLEDAESQVSDILQLLESLSDQNPNIKQCLLIIGVKNEKHEQNILQSRLVGFKPNANNLLDYMTVVREAVNDYDGKKINNRMPSVHRVCTTLPVREASEIRMKREQIKQDIVNIKDSLEGGKSLENYFYYLALCEGMTRKVQSILLQVLNQLSTIIGQLESYQEQFILDAKHNELYV